MEIDITDFFNEVDPGQYSGSVFELGERAGEITWNAALESSADYMYVTKETRPALVAYVRSFGAWDIEEIADWTDVELNAWLLQDIASSMREAECEAVTDDGEWDWEAYERAASEGQVSSTLFKGDDGRIYYYAGS